MKNPKSIRALFAFPGFNASSKLVGKFGDRYARVIQLKRSNFHYRVAEILEVFYVDKPEMTPRRTCLWRIIS